MYVYTFNMKLLTFQVECSVSFDSVITSKSRTGEQPPLTGTKQIL